MFVYLDNSATTKPYTQVVKTMMNALEKAEERYFLHLAVPKVITWQLSVER